MVLLVLVLVVPLVLCHLDHHGVHHDHHGCHPSPCHPWATCRDGGRAVACACRWDRLPAKVMS